MLDSWPCQLDGAWGLKTLTSRKVFSNLPPHTSLVTISNLAPSCELAVAPVRPSLVMGCRSGSVQMSCATSVRRCAVKSLISLCLMEGNPPLAHERACSTANFLPHAHVVGILGGVQPYRRAMASWKAPLCKVKPCSCSGTAVSHTEAPFSLARLIALLRSLGRSAARSLGSDVDLSLFCFCMDALEVIWSANTS